MMVAAFAALAMATVAKAQFIDGADLLAKCKSGNRAFCLGYAAGIADALVTLREGGDVLPKGVCLPNNVVLSSVADVIARRLVERPEARHYTAGSTAMVALLDAFPCPATPKTKQ
ncbi:hypothetical protein ACH79_06445 [Bradyrhizobium sp. CCBAU 051011]|nr:hypothetical protein ACH79_06445 [Bradyrhizobium sp. CCBAU 051011]